MPNMQRPSDKSKYSTPDATTDESVGRWKTNASHNVILDHRFVILGVGLKVAEGILDMETVYVMDISTGSCIRQKNAAENWKKTAQ